jgi:hypothetical protein
MKKKEELVGRVCRFAFTVTETFPFIIAGSKKSRHQQRLDDGTNSLLRSLCAITLINMVGWGSPTVAGWFLPPLAQDNVISTYLLFLDFGGFEHFFEQRKTCLIWF